MGAMASQITSLTIVYSTVYSSADQRKHQRSASLAFVRRIHGWPVTFPHKWPVTWTMFPFDDVIIMPSATTSTVGQLNLHWYQGMTSSQDIHGILSGVSCPLTCGLGQWGTPLRRPCWPYISLCKNFIIVLHTIVFSDLYCISMCKPNRFIVNMSESARYIGSWYKDTPT